MFTLTDTEESMTLTDEQEANYKAAGDEYATIARALLMTCRRLMTGHEIDQCENATGDHDDPDGFNACVIDRLANQFPREIADFVNVKAVTRQPRANSDNT